MVKFVIILSVLAAMSTTSSYPKLQIKMDSASYSTGWTHNQVDRPKENLIYSQSFLSVWIKYHHHLHGIEKRQINKKSSNKTNSLFCASRTSICKYFYPDHPDAGSLRIKDYYNQTNITKNGIRKEQINIDSNHTFLTICEVTSSFCTYYHPDHPNAGQHNRKINGNYSTITTVIAKEMNNGIMKQNEFKNKTIHLTICEDFSSTFCTYFYNNYSVAGRKIKSNYTPTIIADIIDDKKLKDSKKEDFTRLCLQNTTKRNLRNCEGSDQFCIYFYSDHPDADRSITKGHSNQTNDNKINQGTNKQKNMFPNQTLSSIYEDTSSICTYLYPDHPDTGRIVKNKSQTSAINATNNEITIHQTTFDSNQSQHVRVPACKDSSVFCTSKCVFYDAGRKEKSNYSSTKATLLIEETLNDSINSNGFTRMDLEKLCNHQSLDIRLRNTKTKEFFYAASDDWLLDKQRRRVFTWKNVNDIPGIGDEWSGEEIWRLEPVNQSSSNLFRLRNIRPIYGPKEYLFADQSTNGVYVRRDLPNDDSAVLKLGSPAKWQLRAKISSNGELRDHFCNIDLSKVSGWVLENEMHAGYLNTFGDDDINVNDPTGARRNVGLFNGDPNFWDVLPLSSYRPIPAQPRQWKNDQEGTIKWDMKCDFKGKDIGGFLITPSDLECMGQCTRNDKCTHWTYTTPQRKCYLKKADQMKENYDVKSKCGFIPGRSKQKY